MKKIIIKLIPLFLIATLISVFVMGCTPTSDSVDTPAEAVTYVNITINPEIELTVDKNGKVLSVNTLNSDAEILLAEVDLIGMTIEEATEKFVELATEAGYIDVTSQTNNVTITVIDESSDNEENIKKKLEERIYKFFDNNGIFGMVTKETLQAYAEQAASLEISVGKMKMVLRAKDLNPDMTLEELAAMEMKDLVKLINKYHKEEKLDYTARNEFKIKLETLKKEFAAMFALEKEIETLNKQLKDFKGTEEEKTALEDTIEAKEKEHDALKKQFDESKKTLIEDAKELQSEIQAKRKIEKEQKIEEHKEANASHKVKFKSKKEEISKQIKEWREAKKNKGK